MLEVGNAVSFGLLFPLHRREDAALFQEVAPCLDGLIWLIEVNVHTVFVFEGGPRVVVHTRRIFVDAYVPWFLGLNRQKWVILERLKVV